MNPSLYLSPLDSDYTSPKVVKIRPNGGIDLFGIPPQAFCSLRRGTIRGFVPSMGHQKTKKV